MLTLRAVGTSGSGQVIIRALSVRGYRTADWEGRDARWVVWCVEDFRIERGQCYAWTGSFVSAEDALASIDGEVPISN